MDHWDSGSSWNEKLGTFTDFTVPFEYGVACQEMKDADERMQTGASLVVEIDNLIRERDCETDKA